MIRAAGVLALLASVGLGTSLARGLRHFDLKAMRTATGYELVFPGPGPFQSIEEPTKSPGRHLIEWDTQHNCWSINDSSELDARLRNISCNGDVCHREFSLPLVGRTVASTAFIPAQETGGSRSPVHSWAILLSLGAWAATPLLLWGVAAAIWGLSMPRQKRKIPN